MTPRALGIGIAIGILAAISNLYVSLRTGWSLPVMTTAALVGLAAARARGRRLAGAEATSLTAIASAAGYMAGGGNATALPALAMIGGERLPSLVVMAAAWIAIAVAGTLLAPFLRRGTVDGDRPLAFPTATATAALTETAEAKKSPETRALFTTAAAAAVWSLVRNAAGLPITLALPGSLAGRSLASLTFGVDPSFVLVGAGALMTLRTALSTLGGGIVTYAVIVPLFVEAGVVTEVSYRGAALAMVWPSAALLVAAALTTFLLELPKLLRPRAGAAPGFAPPSLGGGAPAARAPRIRPTKSDVRRLVAALAIALAILIFLLRLPIGPVLLGVPVALGLAFVAARAMGETDIVPTKALTPLAQLVFGASGAAVATTTLAPNLTSGIALHAADTLGSLKVAHATGTAPDVAIRARLVGCVVGGVAVAVAYAIVVGDGSTLPTNELPVPGVLVWRSVAIVATRGLASLPDATKLAIAIASGLGVLLALLERALPPRFARWLPSPVGLGSGMVLPVSNAVAIVIGAIAARGLARRRENLVIPIASGLVAGESVIGIAWQAMSALRAVV